MVDLAVSIAPVCMSDIDVLALSLPKTDPPWWEPICEVSSALIPVACAGLSRSWLSLRHDCSPCCCGWLAWV